MKRLGRDYWLFMSGQFVSSLGDTCANIALAWWVYGKTGSGTAMASIMAPSMIVRLICLPLFGPIGDRYSRKKLLALGDFLCALTSFLLAAMAFKDLFNIPLILALSCLSSAGSALFNVAYGGLLSSIVAPEDYRDALRQNKILNSANSIIGGLAGGAVVSFLGFTSAFAFDGFSFLVGGAAALAISHHTVPVRAASAAAASVSSRLAQWKTDIAGGFIFLKRLKIVLNIALLLMCLNLILSPLSIILPIMVRQIQQMPAWYLGALQSSISVGVLLISLSLGFFTRKLANSRIVFLGFALLGTGLAALSLSSGTVLPLIVFPLLGAGMTAAMILLSTQIMTAVPDALRARFSAASSFLIDISRPAGIAASGLLIDLFGVNRSLGLVGFGVALLSPAIFLIPNFTAFIDSKAETVCKLVRQWYPDAFAEESAAA